MKKNNKRAPANKKAPTIYKPTFEELSELVERNSAAAAEHRQVKAEAELQRKRAEREAHSSHVPKTRRGTRRRR